MSVRVSALQLVVIATAATACVKIEKFMFQDGGALGSDDAAHGSDGGGSATGPGAIAYEVGGTYFGELPGMYKLEFSTDGFHFPRALTVGSTPVLAPAGDSCDDEEGVGILYFPAAQVTSTTRSDITIDLADIDPDIEGPGVAKMSIDWQGSFTKTNCTGSPTGRSTFTFFPDGRVTRMDLTSIAVSNLSGTACKCGTGGDVNWEVSTYMAFDSQKYTTFLGAMGSIANVGQNVAAESTICMAGAAHQIAVGWRLRPAHRVRRVATNSVSVFADFVSPGSGDMLSSFPDANAESTTMWISRTSNCGDLRDQLMPFTAGIGPELLITQGVENNSISLGLDGIYGGETAGSSPTDTGYNPNPNGAGAPITLAPSSADVPAFAVWLELSDNPTVGTLTRTPASQLTEWYTVQSLGNHEYLFWFPDGLATGESITIEVQ